MYRLLTIQEFEPFYRAHLLWLRTGKGKRLELHQIRMEYADFSNYNLSNALLSDNVFRDCNFNHADLNCIDLSQCVLYQSSFHFANLYAAKLQGIDFFNVDLRYADMRHADINGSELRCALTNNTQIENVKMNVFTNGYPLACPEKGSFTAFKRAQGYIVELLVPADAKRSSAFGRKGRCNKATVIEITKLDGSAAEITEIASDCDDNFIYKIGETVSVDNFDNNRWNECGEGIHFYITREEAMYG